jgi:hypothetical protein
MAEPVDIFFSYAHEDETLMDDVRRHLILFDRQGLIRKWHDRQIPAGASWKGQLDERLRIAKVILLFVSPDFFASDYCYEQEMAEALRRHEQGTAVVVPIILRPCAWQTAPFAHLQALPADAKPVSTWVDRDTACLDVAQGLMRVISTMAGDGATPDAGKDHRGTTDARAQTGWQSPGDVGSGATTSSAPSRRERGEELYLLSEAYFNALTTHYLPYLSVMQGELTYNQALDMTIAQLNGQQNFLRLEMLVHLYFPALTAALQAVFDTRDRANAILSAHKAAYKQGDIDGYKYVRPLQTALAALVATCKEFKRQAIGVIASP